MRRGCLFGVIGVLGVCLILCGLGYFVAIPRVRNNAQDGVRDAIGTQVAVQIPAGADDIVLPGSYALTAKELQQTLRDNVSLSTVDEIIISITENGLEFGISSSGSQTKYTGLPTEDNGLLRMTNMKASDGFLNFIFPANDLGDAIEEAVNDYLAVNNLKIDTLTLANGEIILDTVAAS